MQVEPKVNWSVCDFKEYRKKTIIINGTKIGNALPEAQLLVRKYFSMSRIHKNNRNNKASGVPLVVTCDFIISLLCKYSLPHEANK